MTTDLYLTTFAVVLTWVMVFFAANIKVKSWTPSGMKAAFGNRETAVDAPGFAGRADRAAKNMIENLPLFLGLIMVAHLGGRTGDRVNLGAHMFVWARLAYWPTYLAGVPYLRTLIWYVSVMGLGVIVTALV